MSGSWVCQWLKVDQRSMTIIGRWNCPFCGILLVAAFSPFLVLVHAGTDVAYVVREEVLAVGYYFMVGW